MIGHYCALYIIAVVVFGYPTRVLHTRIYAVRVGNTNMGEPDPHSSPGPNPSSLQTVDHVPDGLNPISMRITYTSDKVSDYIDLKREGWQIQLELADPLFSIVRKIGKISDFTAEISKALSSIGVAGIGEHFREAVAEYANAVLSIPAFTASISIGVAAYLLTKLYEADLLILSVIHQASIEELPSWKGLIEEAKDHPDITVS